MRKHTCLVTTVAALTFSFGGAAIGVQTCNPACANPIETINVNDAQLKAIWCEA